VRSLFAKILLWFWATLIITVIGSAMISAFRLEVSERRFPLARLAAFELREARQAYERGGREGLAAHMRSLQSTHPGHVFLTDRNGRDLVTSEDRSNLVERARRRETFAVMQRSGVMITRAADDGEYWFFIMFPRGRPGAWFLLPHHWWEIAVGVLLCYWLAFHLTSPVRQLERAVDRFGRGDLSARVNSRRRDELGQLGRAFDQMAGRVETLLTAERRLLLDISHELRSPLARLRVAVELARSGENREAAFNRIEKESERLNDLVSGLLQVTRAESDPGALGAEAVRLDDLLAEVAEDCAMEARAHGCRLGYAANGVLIVKGDAELLRRAVENVVRNAIRYAPPDTEVEMKLESRGPSAVVRVRDRGRGVPAEALPRIFEAFYRVESDRDRASGGVGLGLAIARRAVELHKGTIRARNVEPGLEVEIELPAATSLS
jgi:two-component system sensor histidine kinase CpxA